MSDSAEDRIHAATPARQQQARRDGDVAKSLELAAAVQTLGAITAAYLFLGQVGNWIRAWTTETWSSAGSRLSVESGEFTVQIQDAITGSMTVLLPLMLLLFLVGVASHWLQTGPMFLAGRVAPDPARLASGDWRQHVFSLSSLAFVIVGIPKTLIAAVALGTSAWCHRNDFFALANFPVDAMIAKLTSLTLTVTFHVTLAMLVTSAADYWLKYISHQRRIRMTDQQLRDELRMQNGDPQIHARRRRMNRAA